MYKHTETLTIKSIVTDIDEWLWEGDFDKVVDEIVYLLDLHNVEASAFDAVNLWNEATKLSTLECNGYWKALKDLDKLGVIKIGGLESD